MTSVGLKEPNANTTDKRKRERWEMTGSSIWSTPIGTLYQTEGKRETYISTDKTHTCCCAVVVFCSNLI